MLRRCNKCYKIRNNNNNANYYEFYNIYYITCLVDEGGLIILVRYAVAGNLNLVVAFSKNGTKIEQWGGPTAQPPQQVAFFQS